MKIKITFFNTVQQEQGQYTIHRSTTPKEVFFKTYNTDSVKRAFSFARRFINKQDSELGRNTCIESVN